MKRQKICHWTTVIAGVLYCAGACQQKTARAEFTAVNWVGDYIPTAVAPPYTYLNGHTGVPGDPSYLDPNSAGGEVGRVVSDSIPYSPVLPGYDQPTRLSSVFYGGHVVQWGDNSTNPGFDDLQVENRTPLVDTADYLHVSVQNNAQLTRTAALFYWKKDNFTNGFSDPAAAIEFSNKSYFQLGAMPINPSSIVLDQPASEAERIRWVVRNGSQFYMSTSYEEIYNRSDNSVVTLASAVTWQTYNPFGSLSNIFFNSGTNANTSDFKDITGLGFYISSEDNDSTNNDIDLLIKQFNVTANLRVVPEPGFAMVGLFGVGLFAVRRLKNRKSTSSVVCAEDSSAVAQTASV